MHSNLIPFAWRAAGASLGIASIALFAACSDGASPESIDQTQEPLLTSSGGGTSLPTMPTTPTDPTVVGTGPVSLAPLSLVGFEFWDRVTKNVTDVARINGHLTWPSPYDIVPTRVHFLWKPQGTFPAADIPKLSVRDGYALDVYLNGTKLVDTHQGANLGDFYTTVFPGGAAGCPAGISCIGVSVEGHALPTSGTWDLKLVFWQPAVRGSSQTVVGYVSPNPTPTSYFLEKIAPVFQSERCMHCHQLGSQALLIAHHVNNNVGLSAGEIFETEVPPNGTQIRCAQVSGCHSSISYSVYPKKFLENEWMTPKFDQGIDWTGKTPYLICQKIKSRLTTPDKMKRHFFEDARIGWAVHDAMTPNGVQHSKAPPGDYYAFVDLMTPWIDGGQACP